MSSTSCGRILVHLDVKDRAIIPQVRRLCQDLRVDQQVDFWADVRTPADQAWIADEILAHGVPFIARVRLEQADGMAQLDLAMALKPTVCELSFTSLDQVIGVRDRILEAGTVMWVNTLDSVASAGFTDSAALLDPAGVWGRLMNAGFTCMQTDQSAALQDYRARRAGLHAVR